MCVEKDSNYDIKMLALKRWDLDKTNRLFNSDTPRGDYISFQSYHFIDVISPAGNQELRDIYERFRQTAEKDRANSISKSRNSTQEELDIHTVQSITILSKSQYKDFWELNAPLLGITFIQLTDSTQWHYEKIQKELTTILGDSIQWALYYSLDFCDLVLFTKNFQMEQLHDALWKMALVRERSCKVICDTFTILCFAADFLKKNFNWIDAAKKSKKNSMELPADLVWQDNLSLFINLSIKNTTSLSKLIKNFAAEEITFTQYRQPGRYDVNIQIPGITGNQAIKILYLIDQQACFKRRRVKKQNEIDIQMEDESYQPIGSYEAIFMANAWSSEKGKEAFPESKQEFETLILSKLETMLNQLGGFICEHGEYINETIRALCELSNNGFSEEFVLSVYPSFATYIELLQQTEDFLENDDNIELRQSRNNITKNYFTALNTLTLCTMHSERQFIHAPAFNAAYFEIPPKLLAFYNAVVDRVARAISNVDTNPYSYMITPDYRADINVHPLNVDYKWDTLVHLAIIHLPERYFYDPQSAIMLLSHEVGHYEGERNRELRARSIFTMLSVVLLVETGYFPLFDNGTDTIPETSLVITLAKCLGEYFYESFSEEVPEPHRGISGHLCDVSDFLERNCYGLKFFDIEESRHNIIHRWVCSLRTTYNNSDLPRAEVSYILEKYDKRINVSYYKNLLMDETTEAAVEPICRILAEGCAKIIQVSAGKSSYDTIVLMGQTIIQSFSESFSDMQMVRVCGKHFSLEKFVQLILQNNPSQSDIDISDKITLEHIIRYNTICRVFDFEQKSPNFEPESSIVSTIIKYVSDYIDLCIKKSPVEESLIEFVDEFLTANPFGQCECISRVLCEYKAGITDELERTEYC